MTFEMHLIHFLSFSLVFLLFLVLVLVCCLDVLAGIANWPPGAWHSKPGRGKV